MAGKREYEMLFKLQAKLGGTFNKSMQSAMKATTSLGNELDKVNKISGKIDSYKKQREQLEANKQKLSDLKYKYKDLQQEIKNTKKPSQQLIKEFKRTASQIETTENKINSGRKAIGELSKDLKKAGVNTRDLAGENKRLADSYDKIKNNQEKLARLGELQGKNAEAISKTKRQLGGTIAVATAVGAAIVAGPVNKSVQFNKELASVGTLLDGDIKPRLNELSKGVVSLSSKTGIGTSDLTDGLYQVVSAFGDSAEAIDQLEIAAQAAKAGNATTTDSINLLSAVTKGYGDTSAESQRKAADLAFMTAKLGQTTFPELAASMGKVAPLASSLTVSQEELFGAMSTLTGVTGNTAEVATQLKGTFTGFMKPTKEMQAAMEKLGYANGKVMLESLGLQGTLEALKGSVDGDEIAFANLFGSIEAKSAVLAMTGAQAENLANKTNQMYDAAGAAQKAFDIMNNTPEAKIEKAKNAVANLGLVIGDVLLPTVTEAAEKVADVVIKMQDWASKNPKTVKTILAVAGGLTALKIGGLGAKLAFLEVKGGTLAAVNAMTQFKVGAQGAAGGAENLKGVFFSLGKATNALKSNAGVMGVFSKVGGIAAKLLPVLGVVALIGGAIYMVATHLEDVRAFIKKTFGTEALKLFDSVVNAIRSIGQAFKLIFSGDVQGARDVIEKTFGKSGTAVFDTFLNIIKSVKEVLHQLGEKLSDLAQKALPLLKELLGAIITQFSNLASAVLPLLIELWSTIFSVIAEAVSGILPVLKDLLVNIFGIISEVLGAVLPVFIELIGAIIEKVSEIIQAVLPQLIELINFVVPIISDVVSFILPILIELIQTLIPIITWLADVFGNVLGVAISGVRDIVSGIIEVFNGLIDFITGVFTGNWSQAWEGVKGVFGGIFDSIVGIAKTVINAVIAVINGAIRGINKISVDVPDWVPGLGGKHLGFNMQQIPMLAKGSNDSPDTFIAGEKGAELVTNAKHSKVFTAAETGRIFDNINIAKNLSGGETAVSILPLLQAMWQKVQESKPKPKPAEFAGATGGGGSVVIYSNPTFYVGENTDTDDIIKMLNERDEALLDKFDEKTRSREDDDKRTRYD